MSEMGLFNYEIRDCDVFESSRANDVPLESLVVRKTARAIVTNSVGNVALLYASRLSTHQLVGGGIENGEDPPAAVRREALEEGGIVLDKVKYVGTITELREATRQKIISYCFEATGEKMHAPHYTFNERIQGCKLKWAENPTEAIETLAADHPRGYRARFISFRDRLFLGTTQDILENH